MRARLWMLALLACLATTSVAFAQVQSGNISGTVKDEQGGVLPGVAGDGAGQRPVVRRVVTESDGQFRFLNRAARHLHADGGAPGLPHRHPRRRRRRRRPERAAARSRWAWRQSPNRSPSAAIRRSSTPRRWAPRPTSRRTSWRGCRTRATRGRSSARCPASRSIASTSPATKPDSRPASCRRAAVRATRCGRWTACRSRTWRRPARHRRTSTTTPSTKSRSRPAATTSSRPTGGVGLNFVVKRGTNQFRGTARGYFTERQPRGDEPAGRAARPRAAVTAETADHNKQISEFGVDVGGPIVKDKLFFWGSIAKQDIRLYRQSARGIDRTVLKTYNAKVN